MTGNIAVTPGHTLNILVGQQGVANSSGVTANGGGGGGSFVWDVTAGNILLVAAGGGGGAAGQYKINIFGDVTGATGAVGLNATTANNGIGGTTGGGNGGTGGNGGVAATGAGADYAWGAGGAGWLSNGAVGAGGAAGCGGTDAVGGSTPLSGGAGGAGSSGDGYQGTGGYGGGGGSEGSCDQAGGGGGGGYSGGGGGALAITGAATETVKGGPGGGGGSYMIAGATGTTNSVANTGNGSVTICTWPSVGTITVSPSSSLCSGTSATLSTNGTASGAWTSVTTTVATITGTTVNGVGSGTSVISYTATNVCGTAAATTTVTVNASPGAISGSLSIICGGSTSLSDATAGGTWSTTAGTGSVSLTGTATTVVGVTAATSGTATIKYTNSSGCSTSVIVTVAAAISPITGNGVICGTGSTTLSDLSAAGTWTTVAGTGSVGLTGTGATTVTVAGITAGTAVVSYAITGGCNATTTITVNAQPTIIMGNTNVCTGGSFTTLSDAVSGGTWSSSNGNVTVAGAGTTSTVYGVTGGTTSTITYSTGPSCSATTIVTVYTAPAAIFYSSSTVCQSGTTVLNDAVGGGTWSSANTAIASLTGTTGSFTTVNGVGAGATTITYTIGGNACYVTQPMTVTGIPGPITGTAIVCMGNSVNLTDNISGGAWTTSSGAIATVGVTTALSPGSTAVINGVGVGVVTISYNTGCAPAATMIFTVTAAPSTISGGSTVCVGSTITLSDTSPAGTWSSSNGNVIVDGSGDVTGEAAGTSIISYTTLCGSTTQVVTVNPAAVIGAITGSGTVCSGSTITLSNPTASGGTGVWNSSNPGVGSVDVSGDVTGITAGTTMITYTLISASCGAAFTTFVVTVNASPVAGVISPLSSSVCQGSTITLSDPTASGGTGGTYSWSSSNLAIGTVDVTGDVTGVSSGVFTVTGTQTTLYCGSASTTATVTVDVIPVAGTIVGPGTVCVGTTITLSNPTASGGTGVWTSSDLAVGTVTATSGDVTGISAGTTIITYTEISASCGSAYTTYIVTVNSSPVVGVISPLSSSVCQGSTITLSDPTASGGTGGTYSWSSSNLAIGTVDVTGDVTGLSPGVFTVTGTQTTLYCGSASTTATVTVDVIPVAGTITGPGTVCTGSTITLIDPTASGGTGVWSSSDLAIGTIDATTGIVYGVLAGTTMITYTEVSASCGSTFTTFTVTVNTTPAAGTITGNSPVCEGSILTLGDGTAFGGAGSTGTWSSSNPAVGSVDVTGDVSALSPGTTTITFVETSAFCGSASTSVIVTVNVIPVAGAIEGPNTVCSGLMITLSDPTASGGTGVWTSSNPGVGTVSSSSGIVTGVSEGTTTIINTVTSAACGSAAATYVVTVNTTPVAGTITNNTPVCVGSTITLADGTAFGGTGSTGTWSSSNPANGSIGSLSGIVTGIGQGTTIVTFVETSAYCGSASTTATVTVDVTPVAGTINGPGAVCVGLTIPLADVTSSGGTGVWSSSNTAVGTVGSTTGIVGGVSGTNTITITYTEANASCGSASTTFIVTVNANPTAITGNAPVCAGLSTTTLNSTPGGGAWSSGTTTVATIDAGSGVVTGGSSVFTESTSIITYSLTTTGCITTTVVTVNPLPTAILGMDSVCVGLTTTLSDAGGGTWSSSNTGAGTVGGTTGIVYGVSGTATTIITYALPTTCIITTIVTVNPLPAGITGTLDVCAGLTTALSDATTPGTWSSATPGVATISLAGVVTGVSAGTDEIIWKLTTGCITTAIVTVNPLPAAILGVDSVCQESTTSLSDGTPSGTWSSSNPAVATVSPGGIVTGTATGATALTATITYTLPTGCITMLEITVNPLPAAITGTLDVCPGLTTLLSDVTAGGTWSSSAPSIGSVPPSFGLVTGNNSGTAIITYKLITGCTATAIVTVNPLPDAITGTPLHVCSGLQIDLSDGTPSGTWSSSNTGVAPVTGGIVTGGPVTTITEAIITYTLPTSCIAIVVVTVDPLPDSINGTLGVCLESYTYLSDATGGTWSSSNGNATIGLTNGTVYGNNAGTSTITNTLSTGCIMTAVVTVNPLPAAITGVMNVCYGLTTQLNDASGGGTWGSNNTAIATVSGTGLVTGTSPGLVSTTTTIIYTLATGCITTTIVTVNPQPDTIKGNTPICYGLTISLSDGIAGGVWSSSATGIATVGTTGEVTTVGAGTATISYSLAAGCIAFDVVTVNPLPTVYSVTPTDSSYCEGGFGIPVTLSGSAVGVSYLIYYIGDTSVTGYLAGTGSALVFDSLTVAGSYTVRATNSTTGCTSLMLGNPIVIITPTVNPTVSIIASTADTVCPGTTVTFSPVPVHGGLAPTYKWSVNGVLVSLDNTYTYIPANGDIVSVVLASDGMCVVPPTATGMLKMSVIPDGNPQVTIAIFPGDTVCQYAAATFTATGTFGGPAPIYIWYVNGVQQAAAGSEFSYNPMTGDIVYCKMVSDYQCRMADTGFSNAAVMTVAPMIIPHVQIEASRGLLIGATQTDSLWTIVTNAGPDPTYQWSIEGVPVSGATNSYFVSYFNNYDSVSCTVTSSGYCDGISAFDWVYISVAPAGVQQYTAGNGNIALIPNPNNGTFTLKGTLGTAVDENVTLEVTDMIGQVVYSSKVVAAGGNINEQIRLSGTLANGMYLLNLRSGSDNKVFHFVIEQ